MNTKIEKGLKYLAAAIFILALAVNVKVTLDDPFVMMSDSAMAVTTSTTTNASAGYVYMAKLTSSVVYGQVAVFEFGCTIPYYGVSLPFNCAYTIKEDGVVGHNLNCTFFLTSKCDQSKVGYFPVETTCIPCE